MKFIETFIARPVATTLLAIGIALAGIIAFRMLPVATLPQVDFPTISVNASVAGASPEVMAATKGTIAPWMASLTFGGPDLRTVYLGSLMGTSIPYFRAPVAGLPMAHWNR